MEQMDYVLLSLNDEILLRIFQKLNLHDQIEIARVCKRFQGLLQNFWCIVYIILYIDFMDTHKDLTDADFDFLLKSICTTTQVVALNSLTSEKLNVLKMHILPNVHTLHFNQCPPEFMGDNDILCFHKIFPNLRSFSPQGNLTGRYITNWSELHYVGLNFCRDLRYRYFRQILHELPLRSIVMDIAVDLKHVVDYCLEDFRKLEAIVFNFYEADLFLARKDNLKYFTNIKEIILVDLESLMDVVALYKKLTLYKANNVVSIEIDNSSLALETAFSVHDAHLDNNSADHITSKTNISVFLDSVNYFSALHNLREIKLIVCFFEHDYDISKLLLLNRKLEFISIEFCQMKFAKVNLNAREITEHRTKLLTLNSFDNSEFQFSNSSTVFLEFNVAEPNELFKITNVPPNDNPEHHPIKLKLQESDTVEELCDAIFKAEI